VPPDGFGFSVASRYGRIASFMSRIASAIFFRRAAMLGSAEVIVSVTPLSRFFTWTFESAPLITIGNIPPTFVCPRASAVAPALLVAGVAGVAAGAVVAVAAVVVGAAGVAPALLVAGVAVALPLLATVVVAALLTIVVLAPTPVPTFSFLSGAPVHPPTDTPPPDAEEPPPDEPIDIVPPSAIARPAPRSPVAPSVTTIISGIRFMIAASLARPGLTGV
jgi:hypothetical protein